MQHIQGIMPRRYPRANDRLWELGFAYDPFRWLYAEEVPSELRQQLSIETSSLQWLQADLYTSSALFAKRGEGKTTALQGLAFALHSSCRSGITLREVPAGESPLSLVVSYLIHPSSAQVLTLENHQHGLLRAIATGAQGFIEAEPAYFSRQSRRAQGWWWAFLERYSGTPLIYSLQDQSLLDMFQQWYTSNINHSPPFMRRVPLLQKLEHVLRWSRELGFDGLIVLVDCAYSNDPVHLVNVLQPLFTTSALFDRIIWKFVLPHDTADFVTQTTIYQDRRLSVGRWIPWDSEHLRLILRNRLLWASLPRGKTIESLDGVCAPDLREMLKQEQKRESLDATLIEQALQCGKQEPPRSLIYRAHRLFHLRVLQV